MNKPIDRTGRAGTGRRPGEAAIAADARRLLAHLGKPGAFARRSASDPGRLDLFAARGSVSLGAGTVHAAAGERLVAEDRAVWQRGEAGRGHLVISPAGGAALRRRQAGGGEDGFLAQHASFASRTMMVDGEERRLRVNEAESPLAWLHRRRDRDGQPLIDAGAFAAGERLRADLALARMLPRVTANWSAPVAGGPRAGGDDPAAASDAVIAARQRVRRALAAAGPDFAGLLVDVCGFLKGLDLVERERGWPARSGKVVLRLALGRLAAHYGLSGEARGRHAARGLRTWLAPDGRPTLDGREGG